LLWQPRAFRRRFWLHGGTAPSQHRRHAAPLPGSPALARAYLRADDRLILNELHSTAFPNLGRWARKDARVAVHKRDGLEALVALLPPTPRRAWSWSIQLRGQNEYARRLKRSPNLRKWPEGTFSFGIRC